MMDDQIDPERLTTAGALELVARLAARRGDDDAANIARGRAVVAAGRADDERRIHQEIDDLESKPFEVLDASWLD